MKNYRGLVPIVLVFLLAISIFSYIRNIDTENTEYNTYISQGDQYYNDKLYVKAINEYAKAQAMKDSVDVDKKVADCYEIQKLDLETKNLYESILNKYPKNIKAYEYAMEYFMRIEDYTSIYSINETMVKRKLSSDTTKEIIESVRYSFYLESTDYVDVGEYISNYCTVKAESGFIGLLNIKGNHVIPSRYQQMGNYMSEAIPVITTDEECFFVDINGNRTLNFNGEGAAEELGTITDGKYWVKMNDTYAYYDLDGQRLSEDYQMATNFNGDYAVVQKDDRWIIINDNFEQVSSESYADIIIDSNGYAIRKGLLFINIQGKGYQLANQKGEIITEEYFDDARLMIDGTYAAVKKNEKWGFIDTEGKYIVEPEYEEAKSFSNGLAAIKKEDKWGFINEENQIVIEPQYTETRSFNSSFNCFVKVEEKWNLLRLYSGNL